MATQQETAVLSVLLNGEQAKAEISDLEKKAEELKEKIKQVGKDSELGKKFTKELSETNKTIKDLNKHVVEVDKVLKNLSTAKPKELRQTLSALNKQLQFTDIKRGSEEWKQLQENIRKVKQEIKNVSAESQIAESRMSRLSNGFNKYFGMVTAGVAAISGVAFGIKNLISGNAQLSDSFSDVMKTTGLTRKEVQGLYKDFKSLDTRTSRERLLELARDAGKLGIQGTDNIMRFVKAADQIDVALGEDLGEDAIKNIGKLISVLENVPVKMGGVSRSMSEMKLDDQMLSVGSAINTLGQSSTANEGYIVEFTQRLSGVAAQAQISVADVMGFASVLDQSGQKVEMASTVMQNFITKIFEEPAKFARMAGMEISEFNELLRVDTNQAIVTVIEALSKKGGFQQLIPIFKDMGLDGSRAIGVISALAKNVEKLTEAQRISNEAFITGTSISNEFQTKNDNLAGTLEKLGKNIKGWFTNSKFVGWLSDVASGLEKITRSAQSANEAYAEQNKNVLHLKMNIEPLAARYDELAAKTARSADENAELKRIITEITGVIPGAVSAVDEYGNAIEISTQRVREFINTEIARLGVVNKKAIGENKKTLDKVEKDLIASKKRIDEINATGTYTKIKTTTKDKEGNRYEIIKKASAEEVAAEQEKYRQLLQDKKGYEAEINRLSGQTLQKQMEQAAADRKAKEEELAREKEYFSKKKAELKKMADAGDELAKKIYKQKYPVIDAPPGGDAKASKQRETLNDALKGIEAKHLEAMAAIKKQYAEGDIKTEYEYNQQLLEQQETFDKDRKNKLNELLKDVLTDKSVRLDAAKQIADIEQKNYDRKIQQAGKIKKILLDADPVEAEKQAYEARLRELGLFNLKEEDRTEKQKEALKLLEEQHNENMRKLSSKEAVKKLKELETEQARAKAELNARRIKEKMSEQQYKDELLKIELEFIKKKLALNGISPEKVEQLNTQEANSQSGNATDREKAREAVLSQYGIKDLKSQKEAELAMIQYYEDQNILSDKEAAEARRQIDKAYLDEKIAKFAEANEKIQGFTSDLSTAVSGFQEAETMAVNRKYDQQIKAAGKNSKKVAQLEEEKEKELRQIKAKYADKQFIVTIAQVISSTALAAMQSYSSMSVIPVVGPALGAIAAAAAIAAGAAQIAVAKEQREAAKAGYASGGFTPDGPWDKPQGIIHSNEFIGNRFAVQNPAVRKIFNVVDEAQKNNTVSSLTEKDFARALNYREAENRHLVSGISAAVSSSAGENGNDRQALELIAAYLNRNAEVTERLNKRLDEPFETINSVTGKHGMKRALDTYDRLIKNKSRSKKP
jgi:TP901 family phage tail tape measure protein